MHLHRERGLRCALRLSMEIQPHGCCFDACVLCLRLLVASVAGSPVGGRVGVFLTLDLVVRCSSTTGAGIEFWCPGTLCGSPGSRAGIVGRLAPPPSGVAIGSILYTLDVLCIDRFSGQSWPILDFPLSGFSVGLCRFFLA